MSYKYEIHVHTAESSMCGVATAVEQVHLYKERGYQGMIVTDHFINSSSTCFVKFDWENTAFDWEEAMKFVVAGYNAAKEEGDKIGFDVFFGWEFMVKGTGTDLLTYGLEPDFLLKNPYMHTLDLADYSELIRSNGGFITQAHPYRNRGYIKQVGPVDAQYVDAIEVYNAADPDETNVLALEFAKEHNLPMQAGSDSHHVDIPFASGIILDTRATSSMDIINAIKNETAQLILPEKGENE